MQFSPSERVRYLKEFGVHSQSFSTLQPGMRYFDVPGAGYIGYMNCWGKVFALADPVAARGDFELMLTRFHRRFPDACYVQVSREVVDTLHHRFGLYGTQFGSEARIDLTGWSLAGRRKQVLRTAVNQARKRGIVVLERSSDDQLREMSDAWIRTRRCNKEMRFLVHPLTMTYRENQRCFYACENDRSIGFILFDPIYKGNRIISYVPNVSRSSPGFRQGIFYLIMTHAIDVFKREGVGFIDLGLIPLMFAPGDERQESKALKRLMRVLYERGNFLYSFKGLEFTKSRFQARLEKTYCCHKRALPLLESLAILRLTRLI